MMPRTFPAVVSTIGPSYFDDGSTPKAAAGIKPLKRPLAAATPPPSSEDFRSARRPKFTFGTWFWGLQLLFRRMDLPPIVNRVVIFETEIGNPEIECIPNFADGRGIPYFRV